MKLLEQFKAGNRRALSQAITWIENKKKGYEKILEELFPLIGKAHRIGITGPPGSGKSTLISVLTEQYRKTGSKIGILCIDPSSTFHGGALLGDRYRMGIHSLDKNVFIRSTANRGALGGISDSTVEICDLMDAFGFDPIFIETVGVGQSEIDVVDVADTILVNLSPEAGDSIQGMKSGLMEIAQLIFVNKADRPEALRLAQELISVFELTKNYHESEPIKILTGSALKEDGISELRESLTLHYQSLVQSKKLLEIQQKRILKQIRRKVEHYLFKQLEQSSILNQIEELSFELAKERKSYREKLQRLLESIEIKLVSP